VRRRDFIATLCGAAVAFPFGTRAQKAMPVIGFLNGFGPEDRANEVAGFKQGLKENGFIEGRNVAIEYRWARSRLEPVQELAADLVSRRADVIVISGGERGNIVAKKLTQTIPIVSIFAGDPVADGYIASLNHPGGNFTGASLFAVTLAAKRLEILHELVPNASTIAVLTDSAIRFDNGREETEEAAQKLGLRLRIVNGGTLEQLESAFATLSGERVSALLISSVPTFAVGSFRDRIVALATQYAIPAGYSDRSQVLAGGLISYGVNVTAIYRQLGRYAARVLLGDKPGDLPVVQPTTFELVINLKTAKTLGLAIPPTLLARADEVIE